MLKKILFINIMLLCVFVSDALAENFSSNIKISGEINGLPKGFIILNLEEDINRKKSKTVATIEVDENGRFSFESNLVPHIYSLKINQQKTVMLAVDLGQNIVIKGSAADLSSLKINGSEDTAKLEAYENFRKQSLNRLVISIRNKIKDLQKNKTPPNSPIFLELAKLEVENYDKHKDEMIEFVKKEMGTSVAIYPTSIRWDGEENIPFLVELAKNFETAHPNLEITEKVKEKVRILANTSIGGNVAEIKMPDKNGKIISLNSIKAKYILIDFWGSWCSPCRRESKELNGLYLKYKRKGFDIYGVGLESEKAMWLKAIEQDKRIWTNVSTFQEFETPITFEYAVTSLPANFLIDGNGKIIAKNRHGDELKKILEQLFAKKVGFFAN